MHIFMQQYKQIKKNKYIYTNYVSNAENVQILPQNHRISSLLSKFLSPNISEKKHHWSCLGVFIYIPSTNLFSG
jgi:hypothetical protein